MYPKQNSVFNRKLYFTLFLVLCTFLQNIYAQTNPPTSSANNAQVSSQGPPGWSNISGTPDVSNTAGWGWNGSTWDNPVSNPPNGEQSWLSAHSGEISEMTISNLTVGVAYQFDFYYMSQAASGGFPAATFSPVFRYKIDGVMVTKTINTSGVWQFEPLTFTATATTATFSFVGGDKDVYLSTYELTNISFPANGVQPAVPTCPTINLTTPFSVSICNGQTATLTVTGPATPNYTYTWMPGGATGKTINVNPNDTTAYQVTADSSGCNKTANTIVVVNPVPVVTSTSATVCPGQTATLTASGASSYVWSPGTNLSATTGSSVNSTPPGNISYTVTGTSDGCSATAVSSVTIAGSIPISVNSETICAGASTTLIASGGTTYSWSDATTANPKTVSPGATTSYTVTGTTNGCSGTAVATVTISAALAVTATSTTVCAGVSTTLTAGGATTYVWSDGSTAGTLTAAPLTPTSYTVTGTSNGCTGTAVGTINHTQEDDATFSYTPSTVCKTGGTNPMPVISGTTGGSFSCPDGTLTLNTTTGEIDLISPIGTYTVTYTTAGTCPDSKTYVISIVNVPDATFNYAGPYCQNVTDPLPAFPSGSSAGVFSASPAGLVFGGSLPGEVDLSASTPNSYTVTNTIAAGNGCPSAIASNTITINAVPVTTATNTVVCGGVSTTLTAGGATTYLWSDGTTAGTLTAAPLNTTSYTVTGTTAGCSQSAVGTITANPIPNVTVNSETVCEGTPATLTASGAASYVWSSGSTAGSLTESPANTTSYTVTGTTAGCPSSAVATITVNAMPNVTVNSTPICAGQPAILEASGATTYLWSDGNTINPRTVTPSSTTSYTIVGTAIGCKGTAVSTVTVAQVPLITVNSETICNGESVTLTGSGGLTYAWSTGTPGNVLTVSPTSTTSYTITGGPVGCSGFAVATVTVNTPPIVTVNAANICEGESATLTAGGASSYVWTGGSTAASLTASPTATTSYTVIGNPGGCPGSAVASINVQPKPVITVSTASVCSGSTTTLFAFGGTSYVWSTGSVLDSTAVLPTVASGQYTVSVTGTGGGCSNTAVGTVTVYPIPTAGFSSDPNPVGVLSPVISFTDRSSIDVTSWSWTFGDGDSLAGTQNPVHTYPSVETTYTVTLNVLNAGLCPGTISRTVVVGPEFSFYIPNAFSPNDDHKNDLFGGTGTGINKYKLLVFDRWGNQIFKTEDLSGTWDGKANGGAEVAQQDVYVWKVNIIDVFKKEHEFVGTVTIVK